MRAVSYAWVHGPRPPTMWWTAPDKHCEPNYICRVLEIVTSPGDVLSVRYDNGQLCTFRRKETKR